MLAREGYKNLLRLYAKVLNLFCFVESKNLFILYLLKMTLSQKFKNWKKDNRRMFRYSYLAKYYVLSFLGLIYRSVRYKTDYFLDTNFVITEEEKYDNRYKKTFFLSKRFYITEPIKREMEEKLLDKKFKKVNSQKLKSVSFDDLYRVAPICPVYHNFISTMNNPADFTSPEFMLQLIFSRILKKKKLTDEETQIHMLEMNRHISMADSKINEGGEVKSEWEEVIGEAHKRSLLKRKDGLKGKNKNYANDIRNLALIFTYCLIYKRNVTFLTSDSDAVAYFFDWSASAIQQFVFSTKCLEELNKHNREGMKRLLQKNRDAIFFNAHELRKFQQGTLQKFYSNDKKYFSPRLSIKYWDKNRKKFFEIGINIDSSTRLLFMYLHGPLNCPTAKNDLMGSFIGYRYWWPPSSKWNAKTFKILPKLKPIYSQSEHMPISIHNVACRYRRNDLSDNFTEFSSFS